MSNKLQETDQGAGVESPDIKLTKLRTQWALILGFLVFFWQLNAILNIQNIRSCYLPFWGKAYPSHLLILGITGLPFALWPLHLIIHRYQRSVRSRHIAAWFPVKPVLEGKDTVWYRFAAFLFFVLGPTSVQLYFVGRFFDDNHVTMAWKDASKVPREPQFRSFALLWKARDPETGKIAMPWASNWCWDYRYDRQAYFQENNVQRDKQTGEYPREAEEKANAMSISALPIVQPWFFLVQGVIFSISGGVMFVRGLRDHPTSWASSKSPILVFLDRYKKAWLDGGTPLYLILDPDATSPPSVPPDTEGVHAVANTMVSDRIADIVFVHGLAGGPHSTWLNSESASTFFWPAELGRELPQCGIWTVGYAAGITEFGKPGMKINTRGRNILNQLIAKRIGTDPNRPVIFITHSMGGLVIKALILASDRSADQPRRAFAKHVKGIVFCGTPHRGADLAKAAGTIGRYSSWIGFIIGNLAGWVIGDLIGRVLRVQAHVKQMAANSDELDNQNIEFGGWFNRNEFPISIATFRESNPVGRRFFIGNVVNLGMVVPPPSAYLGLGEEPVDVDADHFALVKPSPSYPPNFDLVYTGVHDFIKRTLTSPQQGGR